jgi:hypothetical protein
MTTEDARFPLFVIPSEVEESLTVAFEDNELLFGANKTARIVAIEIATILRLYLAAPLVSADV